MENCAWMNIMRAEEGVRGGGGGWIDRAITAGSNADRWIASCHDAHRQQPSRGGRWVLAVANGIALVMLLVGIYVVLRDWSYTTVTEGVVVADGSDDTREDAEDNPDPDDGLQQQDPRQRRDFFIRYSAGGMDYFLRVRRSVAWGYRVGDRICVWFSEQDPRCATLRIPQGERGLSVALVGGTFLAASLFPLWLGFCAAR